MLNDAMRATFCLVCCAHLVEAANVQAERHVHKREEQNAKKRHLRREAERRVARGWAEQCDRVK